MSSPPTHIVIPESCSRKGIRVNRKRFRKMYHGLGIRNISFEYEHSVLASENHARRIVNKFHEKSDTQLAYISGQVSDLFTKRIHLAQNNEAEIGRLRRTWGKMVATATEQLRCLGILIKESRHQALSLWDWNKLQYLMGSIHCVLYLGQMLMLENGMELASCEEIMDPPTQSDREKTQ